MAQSPSPGPSAAWAVNRRLSATPPLLLQPLSKRDKKRRTIDQKLRDIVTSFATNREYHLRSQLNAINRDMHFINRVNLYQNRPVDDNADEIFSDIVSQAGTGSVDGEARAPPLGRFASEFVEDVNDAMEDRDAQLTELHKRFTNGLENLQLDYEFAVEAAETEHGALSEAIRERLIATVRAKKKQLQKEKELLDSADYNTLTNNSQFTVIQPASPGGAHSNRKTRTTRRHDADGPDAGGDGGKRKRKSMADPAAEPSGLGARMSADGHACALWDKQEQTATDPTLDRYFSSRDFDMHAKEARGQVARVWASKRARHQNGNGRGLQGVRRPLDGHPHDAADAGRGLAVDKDDGEEGDEEAMDLDGPALLTPAMDRTGSHATRSTRNQQPTENSLHYDVFGPTAQDPHRLHGTAVMEAQTLRAHAPNAASSKDIEVPWLQGFSPQEQLDDWAFLQAAADTE